jgi:hypothetical protein
MDTSLAKSNINTSFNATGKTLAFLFGLLFSIYTIIVIVYQEYIEPNKQSSYKEIMNRIIEDLRIILAE